ncbi:MAG: phage scaffolding protein, partial [Anaerotignum sp.]
MKTEFLKGLGIEDDAIAKIMAENGKDIEKEKVKAADLNSKLEEANKKVSSYEATISDLKKSAEGNEDFKKKFEDLEQKIAEERAAAEKKAKEEAEEADFSNRFKTVVGEQKWRDELTEKAVYSEFKTALKDEANKGKGDKDILEALTKDKNY